MRKLISLGFFLIATAIWSGGYGMHFYRGEWQEIPCFLSAICVALTGLILIVSGLIKYANIKNI